MRPFTYALTLLDSKMCTGDIEEREQRLLVVRDQQSMEGEYAKQLWDFGDGAASEPPDVDFTSDVVLALYFGSGACNDEIRVTASEQANEVQVTARRLSKCVVQPLNTYPFAFVKLPRSDKEYRVNFEAERSDCP